MNNNETLRNEGNKMSYTEKNRGLRRHLLITKGIENKLPKLYSQENVSDPSVAVKFFSPYNGWKWYATEGERTADGDIRFFGLVVGDFTELGYFMLSELESATVFGRVPAVERDCYFGDHKISEFK
jgi:hypothetical protein